MKKHIELAAYSYLSPNHEKHAFTKKLSPDTSLADVFLSAKDIFENKEEPGDIRGVTVYFLDGSVLEMRGFPNVNFNPNVPLDKKTVR